MGSSRYNGCPPGFHELIMQRQLDSEKDPNVLYKFTSEVDALREFHIRKAIFMRVCKSLIEVVVLKGVQAWELNIVGYFIAHVAGVMLKNEPTPADSSNLRHILNIKNSTSSKEVSDAMKKNINPTAFPQHYVISAKFNIIHSPLAHKISSKHTIRRIINAHKP